MKKLLPLFILICLAVFSGCENSAKTNVPSWFLNPPKDAEKIYGAGVSKNEGSALLHSIIEICEKIETKTDYNETKFDDFTEKVFKSVIGFKIGNILIESVSSSYKESKESDIISDFFEITTRLSFSNETEIVIEYYNSSSIKNKIESNSSNYKIYPESATLMPVYDELLKNGIKVQEKEKIGEQLFLLLSVKKEEATKTFIKPDISKTSFDELEKLFEEYSQE